MRNIPDKEIYQAAAGLLAKYEHNEWKAINHLHDQLWKFEDPLAVDNLEFVRRVENAIRELIDLNSNNKIFH